MGDRAGEAGDTRGTFPRAGGGTRSKRERICLAREALPAAMEQWMRARAEVFLSSGAATSVRPWRGGCVPGGSRWRR